MIDAFTVTVAAARSARLTQVANEGCAAWVARMGAAARDASRAAQDLLACRNMDEVLRVRHEWIEASVERGAGDVRAAMGMADAFVGALRDRPAAAPGLSDPEAAPAPTRPRRAGKRTRQQPAA